MFLRESGLLPEKSLWKEIEMAKNIYGEMCSLGLAAHAYLKIDVEFVGRSSKDLCELRELLTASFKYEMEPPRRHWFSHRMKGKTSLILLDQESILVWVAEMVKHAHSFRCRLGDWGALLDLRNVPPFEPGTCSASDWFKRGVAASQSCSLTEAFGYFRAATLEDFGFADGFDGMGTVQLDLWLLRAALENYEKAVQLAPEDVSLRLNRGAVHDYLGDLKGALADYDYILDRLPQCSQALLNRGNAKFGAHDIEGACVDWKHAKDLGCDKADSYLRRFCSVSNGN
jgi:tetratricopeptide (TPR) repeat protein